MASNTYTNKMFFNDVLTLIDESDIDDVLRGAMQEKALKALEQLEKRADYAASHKKPSKAKGPGDKTKATIAILSGVLTAEPLTTAEINFLAGTNLNALQVSGAVKFMDNVKSKKVIREVVDAKGLKTERQYTGYYIG